MGWKTINGRRYYYKSEREGGRVKTTYFGAGESGLLIAAFEAAYCQALRVAPVARDPGAVFLALRSAARDAAIIGAASTVRRSVRRIVTGAERHPSWWDL